MLLYLRVFCCDYLEVESSTASFSSGISSSEVIGSAISPSQQSSASLVMGMRLSSSFDSSGILE